MSAYRRTERASSDERRCERDLEEEDRRLSLALMEADIRLKEQQVTLAPWWLLLKVMGWIAVLLWLFVILLVAMGYPVRS